MLPVIGGPVPSVTPVTPSPVAPSPATPVTPSPAPALCVAVVSTTF
jgi:hypothetical protein